MCSRGTPTCASYRSSFAVCWTYDGWLVPHASRGRIAERARPATAGSKTTPILGSACGSACRSAVRYPGSMREMGPRASPHARDARCRLQPRTLQCCMISRGSSRNNNACAPRSNRPRAAHKTRQVDTSSAICISPSVLKPANGGSTPVAAHGPLNIPRPPSAPPPPPRSPMYPRGPPSPCDPKPVRVWKHPVHNLTLDRGCTAVWSLVLANKKYTLTIT